MEIEEKILHIYQVNHRGKGQAVTREDFFKRYGVLLGGIDDRTLRDIYSHLPILTCSAGGFWPKRGSEVAEFLTDLEKVRDSLKARKIRVFVAHKDLLGKPEQQRLRFQ